VEALGTVFFVSGVITSLSFLAAVRLAKRFGLLNTMVFSHIPANILLMFLPLVPSAWGALALLFTREALSHMDVPTRQSYTMAVVAPEERTAAAGLTALSRSAAQSASPSLGGYLTQAVGMASPFILAGATKIVYDVALYLYFRRVKPPEEVRRS
jgi:predicted MFS family arabinose efflux permease